MADYRRSPPTPVSIPLGATGQKVPRPFLSKYRPIVLKSIRMRTLTHRQKNRFPDTEVIATFYYTPPEDGKAPDFQFAPAYLYDAQGQLCAGYANGRNTYDCVSSYHDFSPQPRPDTLIVRYDFGMQGISKDIPYLVLKTNVTVDGCWPLPILAVVRGQTPRINTLVAKH